MFFQFSKFLKFMTWQTTSRRRGAPYVVGDDVCFALKQTKLKNPPPNKRYPNGITVISDSFKNLKFVEINQNITCKGHIGEHIIVTSAHSNIGIIATAIARVDV